MPPRPISFSMVYRSPSAFWGAVAVKFRGGRLSDIPSLLERSQPFWLVDCTIDLHPRKLLEGRIMKNAIATIAGVMALGFAVGCDGGGSNLTLGTAGNVTVLLTDAPFPFSYVKSVDVFVVRIDGKPADVSDTDAENASDTNGWKTLVSPNASINLLDLTNG